MESTWITFLQLQFHFPVLSKVLLVISFRALFFSVPQTPVEETNNELFLTFQMKKLHFPLYLQPKTDVVTWTLETNRQVHIYTNVQYLLFCKSVMF